MIAKEPPMGWNSWDCYGPSVTEETVRANADYMAEHLKQYGWEYIVVDIQWSAPDAKAHNYDPFTDLCMDEYSRLIPAENRFPSSAGGKGFAPLAEYVHSLGLKFGIHIMRGIPRQAVHRNTAIFGSEHTAREIAKTASICSWNTDMYGVDPEKEGAREYYESLFALYAEWGVDFIKCDDIARELPQEESELFLISETLRGCGRDMVFSLSPGPSQLGRAEVYKHTANMWRITDDFWDEWRLLYNMFEYCNLWSVHSGAGHWPDADMLPVGAINQNYSKFNWTKFSFDEERTMITLWSIFRSPLMIGGDLTRLDEATTSLLTNADIIAMNKNSRHSHQVWRWKLLDTELVLWVSVNSEGGWYAAVFNTGEKEVATTIPISDLEIYEPANCMELWSKEEYNDTLELKVDLPRHGAMAYRIWL